MGHPAVRNFMKLRSLEQTLTSFGWRSQLANIAGQTFGRLRDLYKALGYQRVLNVRDYRARYLRNEIANRIVKALPNATWRGGAEIWEDQDPNVDTPFEEAWERLDDRLKIWDVLRRADVLAGVGRYATVLLGGPGELEEPLDRCSPDELVYLVPYAEDDATIERYIIDRQNPRYGLPEFYAIKRTQMLSPTSTASANVGRRVHWTRVLHVADGLLDDRIFGEPRLQCVWNRLDDLEKVAGGGAEAFWRRADKGMQFDLDPTLEADATTQDAFEKQINDYEHGLRRMLLTRGLKVNELGSDVAEFQNSVNALISLIAAGTGIPQRVLMGSEQGKLAAKADRGNWDDRVADRREAFAGPCVVRPFVARLIELGVLPEPTQDYEVRFPELRILDDEQRASVATSWVGLNLPNAEPVVSRDEIRTRVLGLDTWDEANGPGTGEAVPVPTNLQGKEGERWQHVHAAADRFRRGGAQARRGRFLRGSSRARS